MVDALALISISLAIVAIIQSYRASKFSRRLADTEGVFEKPGISVSLFNDPKIEDIIWAIPFPGDGFVEVPLKYDITNNRKKSSIKGLELIVRMTKDLHGGDIAGFDFKTDSLKEVKSKFVDATNYVHKFLVSVDSLSPKQTISYEDKVLFREGTSHECCTIAEDKNGIKVRIKFEVDLAYAIDLILMAEDIEPIRRQFSHVVIDTSKSSLEDYIQKRNKNMQTQSGYNKKSLLKRIYLTKKHKNFMLISGNSSALEKVGSEPLYKLTKFYSTYGTEFINGYEIPAMNIYPRPIKRIFGFKFVAPWL